MSWTSQSSSVNKDICLPKRTGRTSRERGSARVNEKKVKGFPTETGVTGTGESSCSSKASSEEEKRKRDPLRETEQWSALAHPTKETTTGVLLKIKWWREVRKGAAQVESGGK